MSSRNIFKTVGAAIRKQRKRRGWSLKWLAERADLKPDFIDRLEKGEVSVSISDLIGIAEALGVRIRVLLKDV